MTTLQKEINPVLSYEVLPLNSMKVVKIPNGNKGFEYKNKKELERHLRLQDKDGRQYEISSKFWKTFSQTFNISTNVFNYYGYDEVFDRISSTRNNPKIRLTKEIYNGVKARGGTLESHGQAYTITNPDKPLVKPNDFNQLTEVHNGFSVSYQHGVAQAQFNTRFPLEFDVVNGDSKFKTMFEVRVPLDGYGNPSAFLMLMRVVCSNGMVGLSPAFRTEFTLGKDDTSLFSVLDRAVASFNNEEGFHAMKDRVETSLVSYASLNEYIKTVKTVNKAGTTDNWTAKKRTSILRKLSDVASKNTYDTPEFMYGLVGGEEPPVAKSRALPCPCTVYDLINFVTEVSTHHVTSQHARNIVNAFFGDLITASSYDLENTVTSMPDFADYFLNKSN